LAGGYDDLVWSLIWWPQTKQRAHASFASWHEPDVGAALVSDDAELYLMQMWDESTPVHPTRAHVNPNAIVLCAYGSPLTTDGVPNKDCIDFNFDDTWREVGYMDLGTTRKFNFGSGCGGAHSILLVDRWEGMRASTEYRQAEMLEFSQTAKSVTADVTPIYRERFTDTKMVRRRSRLCAERFWLIEDLAVFGDMHDITARFFLRPGLIETDRGVTIETAEGVRLSLLPLLGADTKMTRAIKGYPNQLEGESVMVDFTQRGRECRWLFLAYPQATRQVEADISQGWQAVADAAADFDLPAAERQLRREAVDVSLTVPPYLQRDLPVTRRWWFGQSIHGSAGHLLAAVAEADGKPSHLARRPGDRYLRSHDAHEAAGTGDCDSAALARQNSSGGSLLRHRLQPVRRRWQWGRGFQRQGGDALSAPDQRC